MMSEGQAGTETRRWTIKACADCGNHQTAFALCQHQKDAESRSPAWDRAFEVVEVVEASDPEGTAREDQGAIRLSDDEFECVQTVLRAEAGAINVDRGHSGYSHADVLATLADQIALRRASASGGTRPAFTDEGEALYRVEVEGGGSFLYDEVDVGRFAKRMATEGDTRAFSVAPAPSTSTGRPDAG